MLLLTEDARLICKHQMGHVTNEPSQGLVTIDGRRVLVEPDPENRDIGGCPNYGPTIKPCRKTLKVQRGYSELLSVGGQPICLDTVSGLTDGTPPGVVDYIVKTPGQDWVSEGA